RSNSSHPRRRGLPAARPLQLPSPTTPATLQPLASTVVSKGSYIGAVEIGTSKVAVLIGEVLGDRRLNIVGLGTSSSRGVIKGDVVDFKAASDCAHAAILAAEQRAGVHVDAVY